MPTLLLVHLASRQSRVLNGEFSPEARANFKRRVTYRARQYGGKVLQVLAHRAIIAFHTGDPLSCALALKDDLTQETHAPIQVLHCGTVQGSDALSEQQTLQTLFTLQGVAWPGQVLVSAEAARSCQIPGGIFLQDLGVHLLPDLLEPRRIYQLARNVTGETFPPLRTLSHAPHNLPPQVTPFVGREKELITITGFFRNAAGRWLTLLGPGGIGKTRLALQAGALLIQDFQDGVFRIAMGHLATLNAFLIALSDALRFTFYGREGVAQQLSTYLKDKQVLLVLDGCDQSLEAQTWLSELLNTARGVRVLATARQRLHVPHEEILDVQGLQLPDLKTGQKLEDASATRLFLQSARFHVPDFTPTPEDEAAIISICARLGGLPLGIELAAAWVNALSCQEIAEEVQASLDFLDAALTDDVSGQERSLRKLFDSAWQLMSKPLQETLGLLTVFPADFAAEDAVAVVQRPLDHVQALADKSMLKRLSGERYEIHAVLQPYAREKTLEPTMRALQERFCEHYLHKLEQALPNLRNANQLETLQTLVKERQNMLQAWQWGLRLRRYETLRKALPALVMFMDMRGLWQEAQGLLQQMLQTLWQGSTPPKAEEGLAAGVFAALGLFALRMGQHQQAEVWFKRALELYERQHDQEGIAYARYRLGDVRYTQGDYEEAETLYRSALEIASARHDLWGQMVILNNLANLLLNVGRHDEAKALYQQCLALAEQTGEQWLRATVLSNYGNTLYNEGDLETALRFTQEALDIKRTFGARMGIAAGLLNLGTIYTALKKYTVAETLMRESIQVYREIDDWRGIAAAHEELGYTLTNLERYDEALEAFGESLRLRRLMNDRWGIVSALKGVAHGLTRSGAAQLAMDYLHEAWQILLSLHAPNLQAAVLIEYAATRLALGEYADAYRTLEVVLRQPVDAINQVYALELRQRLSHYLTGEQMVRLRQQVTHLSLADMGAVFNQVEGA